MSDDADAIRALSDSIDRLADASGRSAEAVGGVAEALHREIEGGHGVESSSHRAASSQFFEAAIASATLRDRAAPAAAVAQQPAAAAAPQAFRIEEQQPSDDFHKVRKALMAASLSDYVRNISEDPEGAKAAKENITEAMSRGTENRRSVVLGGAPLTPPPAGNVDAWHEAVMAKSQSKDERLAAEGIVPGGGGPPPIPGGGGSPGGVAPASGGSGGDGDGLAVGAAAGGAAFGGPITAGLAAATLGIHVAKQIGEGISGMIKPGSSGIGSGLQMQNKMDIEGTEQQSDFWGWSGLRQLGNDVGQAGLNYGDLAAGRTSFGPNMASFSGGKEVGG